jgi:isopenicillin N synthase-like dioxygenase
MQGPNQWPSPDLLPEYRPAITAYFDAVSAVGRRLLHLLALGLGLPATWFDDKFEKPIALLRPLHYSGRVSEPDAGCDSGIMCHAAPMVPEDLVDHD